MPSYTTFCCSSIVLYSILIRPKTLYSTDDNQILANSNFINSILKLGSTVSGEFGISIVQLDVVTLLNKTNSIFWGDRAGGTSSC